MRRQLKVLSGSAILFVLVMSMTACGLFLSEPSRLALNHIEEITTQSEEVYNRRRPAFATREQFVLDYLRALNEQNAELVFDVEYASRTNKDSRQVLVIVFEKKYKGGKIERARFHIYVSRDDKVGWRVDRLLLVE